MLAKELASRVVYLWLIISASRIEVLYAEDDLPIFWTNRFDENIVKLNSFAVSSSDINSDNILRDALQNINTYIFEYRRGFRLPGDELLLGDTKSWKFPRQDVAMGINYPEKLENSDSSFCITQFRVFIGQDSSVSQGYLLTGGPGQVHVGLRFIASEAKHMTYDLRIYGIHSDLIKNSTEIFGNSNS